MNPAPTPSTIATIVGPANAGQTDGSDVCLSLSDPFNPTAGQTSRSLQPCTVTVVLEPEAPRSVSVEVGRGNAPIVAITSAGTLPNTGSTSEPLVTASVMVLVAGVTAVVASRRRRGWRK